MVSLAQCFRRVKALLSELEIVSAEQEALLLCERFLPSCYIGELRGRAALAAYGERLPEPEEAERLYLAVSERDKRPLQYILGTWDFLGMPLSVGEGVLCPREDSAALVRLSLKALESVKNPVILDLCAGSGALALGICKSRPDCRAVCVELSDEALFYLNSNIERFGDSRVSAVKLDVLRSEEALSFFAAHSFDLICSNPPYIPSAEIPTLSREVRQEPKMALDGGEDGLMFYRVICEKWTALLKRGGALCCELGDGAAQAVSKIYVCSNLVNIGYEADFSGNLRAIIGTLLK